MDVHHLPRGMVSQGRLAFTVGATSRAFLPVARFCTSRMRINLDKMIFGNFWMSGTPY